METDTDTQPILMTPKEAWLYAATWGSFMTNGDPGACMYGFDENFLLQSEEHRQNCLKWVDDECIAHVKAKPSDYEPDELEKLLRFRSTLVGAPVEDNARYEKLDGFTKAYITAALWIGVEYPEGHPDGDSDKYTDYHQAWVDADSFNEMVEDCRRFQAENAEIIAAAEETGKVKFGPDCASALERAGHDFWMTRTGQGVGFWDGDWPEPYADQLDKAAKAFGDCDLYTGDDGRVYTS